jgi:hypothetical protein
VVTWGIKKKRASNKNVDGGCTSSHENKKFRSSSEVKHKRMVYGFRKTATAVTKLERHIDILILKLLKGKLEEKCSAPNSVA